jgi:Mrp family chromosome partitioning ATPase
MSSVYFEIGRKKTVDEIVEPSDNGETDVEVLRVIGPKAVTAGRNGRLLDRMVQTRDETIKLVQRLFSSNNSETPQIVVFSGVEPGCGCSWVCARVAEILAPHLEGSVCLIDANYHSNSTARHFETEKLEKVPNERTLPPILHNGQPPGTGRLWLASFRQPAGGWQTRGSLDRLRSRLSEMRKDFTVILIDAPPINTYADAALLGSMADGVVMILQANQTRREAAERAKEILDAAGVRVLGAVLNKRTFPIPDFVYRRL